MPALVKTRPEPGIWLEQQPIPEPGPDEVLIKVHRTHHGSSCADRLREVAATLAVGKCLGMECISLTFF